MIKEAIVNNSLLRVWDLEGRERLVEPYALHQGKEGILLHCFQVGGYSSSSPEGWRNLKINQLDHTELAGVRFFPRKEFNPSKLKLVEI